MIKIKRSQKVALPPKKKRKLGYKNTCDEEEENIDKENEDPSWVFSLVSRKVTAKRKRDLKWWRSSKRSAFPLADLLGRGPPKMSVDEKKEFEGKCVRIIVVTFISRR